MAGITVSMEALVSEFKRLPGIGTKTAERLAFFILQSSKEQVQALARAMIHVKETIGFCKICNNLADEKLCTICQDPRRDNGFLCVVEHPRDVAAIEKAGGFHGVYHVLLGSLSPLDGVGPKDIKIAGLLERVRTGRFHEVILATDSDTEGETTALYLAKHLKVSHVKITRVAQGLPMGSHLEYADQATLARAFEGRREL
ncbi:MAG: recombination protein RecR [Candidatus Omnitrophica bacterium]|nr:recombination protein RecR [Candidatus Omnitrophota bacterium]